jgi:hypothetical protein
MRDQGEADCIGVRFDSLQQRSESEPRLAGSGSKALSLLCRLESLRIPLKARSVRGQRGSKAARRRTVRLGLETFEPALSVRPPPSISTQTDTTLFAAECFELCTHRGKPALEDLDDRVADLGRRNSNPIYKPTPAIDLIFGADDHFIGVSIDSDEPLGFLDLPHQIIHGHKLRSPSRPR